MIFTYCCYIKCDGAQKELEAEKDLHLFNFPLYRGTSFGHHHQEESQQKQETY